MTEVRFLRDFVYCHSRKTFDPQMYVDQLIIYAAIQYCNCLLFMLQFSIAIAY